MTFTATPQPSNTPPRVRLDIDADDAGASFTSLSVSRDGALIREQPFVGGSEALAFDYEAPFGVPTTYEVDGTYLPSTAPDWTESWGSLAAWSGDTSDYSVSGGKARSSVTNADITRSASGTIQRVDVTAPSYVRVELLSAADVVVASVQVGSNVIVTGSTSTSVAGAGSFTATLVGGVLSVTAADGSWSATRPYTGTPTKVRVVALPVQAGTYMSKFGTAGAGNGQFNSPEAVAVDSSNNIFVVDTGNDRVQKFNSSGVYQSQFGASGSGNGQFHQPSGIAFDSSGNIFVVDRDNSRVQKFNSSGVYQSQFGTSGSGNGQFNGVTAIAIDSSNNVFVVDGLNNRVQKFNSAGAYQSQFGTFGSGNGQFNAAAGIAIDSSNNMFVTDQYNYRVQKFNSAGVYQSQFGTNGSGNGQFNAPHGIDIDSSNNIFVVDTGNNRVQKFNSSGVYQSQFGASGSGNGQFSSPHGLAIDSSNNILVVDPTGNRVQKFSGATTQATVGAIAPTLAATELNFHATATTTLDIEQAWLIHPTQPSLSASIDPGQGKWRDDGINVDIGTKPTVSRRAVATTHYPVGRRRGVVITHGDRLDGDWTLVLYTPRLQDRDTVQSIVTDQTPLLFRAPQDWTWDLPDGWYSVGDVDESRIFAGLQHPDRNTVLPLTPVDEPIVRQGALWTYGGDLIINATYADSRAEFPTYLDRLAGPEA